MIILTLLPIDVSSVFASGQALPQFQVFIRVPAPRFPHISLLRFFNLNQVISSVAQLYPTLCNPINRSTPGLPVHHQLPEFAQTHVLDSVMPSKHLILCRPLLLLPPIPPSIRVFSNESTLCIRWPKYWSFSFSILPMSIQD